MADILTNPVEICFGSFTVTSTTLAARDLPGDRCEDPGDTRRWPRFRSEVKDPPAQTL
jgi:hypothetical protein